MVCCTKFMWELGDQLLFGEHVMPIGVKKKKRVRVEQMMGKLLKTCTHARRIIVLLIFLQSGLFFVPIVAYKVDKKERKA